jgi:spore coat protein U-like protein
MKGPGLTGTDALKYELYKDTGRTAVWGNATPDWNTPAASPGSKTEVAVLVYGQIAADQEVTVGAYSDTVVATVNF